MLPMAFLLAACGDEPEPVRTVLAATAGESWSSPRFSPDGSRILFSSFAPIGDTGVNNVQRVNVDGTDLQEAHVPHAAIWSADGTRFIYPRWGSLHSRPVDGLPEVLEAEDIGFPSDGRMDVSPDNQWIVFGMAGTSSSGERRGLNLFDWTTREVRTLREDGFSPVLSPDGQRVAYLVRVAPGPFEVRVLTISTGEDLPVMRAIHNHQPMAWMPDGRLVVVTKDGFTFVDPSGVTPQRNLVLEGGAPRELDVSQDGKKLVYGLTGQDDFYLLTGF